MNAFLKCAVLGSFFLTSGCMGYQAPPTAAELKVANYGQFPEGWAQIASTYFQRVMKDPDSVLIGTTKAPRKTWMKYQFLKPIEYGYAFCVSANARNSFGGYTGYRWFLFFVHNNNMTAVITEPRSSADRYSIDETLDVENLQRICVGAQ